MRRKHGNIMVNMMKKHVGKMKVVPQTQVDKKNEK